MAVASSPTASHPHVLSSAGSQDWVLWITPHPDCPSPPQAAAVWPRCSQPALGPCTPRENYPQASGDPGGPQRVAVTFPSGPQSCHLFHGGGGGEDTELVAPRLSWHSSRAQSQACVLSGTSWFPELLGAGPLARSLFRLMAECLLQMSRPPARFPWREGQLSCA